MKRLVIKSKSMPGRYTPKCFCSMDKYRKIIEEDDCRGYCSRHNNPCTTCELQEAFDKLGAYETIGLSPEQVQNLVDHMKYNTKLNKTEIQKILNTPVKKGK